MTLKIGVLSSTRGTALQGTIDAIANGTLNAQIALIISNNANAGVLTRAKTHAIPALYIPPTTNTGDKLTRQQYDTLIHDHLTHAGVDVVLLVGYMRIVSDWFVAQWRGKVLNVHPSLLPAFAGGMDTDVHQAVIDSGTPTTGCTIHHVTEVLDGGEILYQHACPVTPTDTAETLKSRVQKLESQGFVHVLQNLTHKLK